MEEGSGDKEQIHDTSGQRMNLEKSWLYTISREKANREDGRKKKTGEGVREKEKKR